MQRQDTKASTSASDYPTFPHAQTMAAFPEARHDWLQWDDLLSEQEKATKYKVRTFAVSPGAPQRLIQDSWSTVYGSGQCPAACQQPRTQLYLLHV